MRVILVIVFTLIYLTTGYVVTAVIGEGEDIGEEIGSVGVWVMWPLLIGIYVLMKLIPWIGRRVAKIPVMIVKGIKDAKTEHYRESGKDR